MSNSSTITEFLLLAFTDTWELQPLHFWLFLGIYLAALLGNDLIITAIACDQHLHIPMYFLLFNLSVLDLGSLSTILPKTMANSHWDTRVISYARCAVQFFFCLFLVTGEYSLLTIMAYDRYVAICKPLHYGTLLGSRACVHMAAAAWATGFLHAVLRTANTFSLPLCKVNALNQFFCGLPQILKLSCSYSYLRDFALLVVTVCLFFVCFVFIVLSYVQIFRAMLRIPSEQGWHKALFHVPSPPGFGHLVCQHWHIYLPEAPGPLLCIPGPGGVISVLGGASSSEPLIYSMRNQELKESIRKVISWMFVNVDKIFITLHN
ncbi:olfactory receptor 14J1-like [Caloenas nicobarica]|uniref:olfactory receptor 14J1-like n=1 Tax=Caloenas nicobarica TaxID=187106 RepID=UPI0032B7B5C9